MRILFAVLDGFWNLLNLRVGVNPFPVYVMSKSKLVIAMSPYHKRIIKIYLNLLNSIYRQIKFTMELERQ